MLEVKKMNDVEQIIKEYEMKQKTPNSYFIHNPDIYRAGEEWFNSGLPFDEAPEELKTNTNFKNGYGRAQRLAKVAESLYCKGVECYDSGMSYEEVAEKYYETPIVIKGYEDAMINSQTKNRN